MLKPSLRHVGQHSMARFVIWAVPGLPLRYGHDTNRPRAMAARSDLQD
jgi:hypothetical protein